jgi:two-component system phosphate regulon sensor histidine kinase PhoR
MSPNTAPRRLRRSLFFRQLALWAPLTFALWLGLAWGNWDPKLLALSLGFLAISALVSTLTALQIARPLEHVLVKARSLLQSQPESGEPEALSENESREWTDLESALNQIRWDLRKKSDRLDRDRQETQAIMSAAADAICAVDLKGELLFFNSPFATLFGDRELQARRPRVEELFREPALLAAFDSALRRGLPSKTESVLQIQGERLPRNFSISVAPFFRGKSREVEGAVANLHDITELKRAEQIRIEFVENASHELRTPLTSIKGYIATLADDFKNGRHEDLGRYFTIVQRNVDRLIELVNDILDLSSIERTQQIEKTLASTQEITTHVLAQVESQRQEKGHRISCQVESPTVFGDARRIEQVLLNLVDNAIKYLPSGGQIEIAWEKPTPKETRLRVQDNGPGIPLEHQARLFERFYRMEKSRNRESGGTGLGLAIVKHIVQLHGGSIEVKSEPGKGATFFCHFPE